MFLLVISKHTSGLESTGIVDVGCKSNEKKKKSSSNEKVEIHSYLYALVIISISSFIFLNDIQSIISFMALQFLSPLITAYYLIYDERSSNCKRRFLSLALLY